MYEELNEKLGEKLKAISAIREEYECAENKYMNAQREIFEIQKEKLSCLVGRCYQHKNIIFKIIDVPQERIVNRGTYDFNPYLLPALVINRQDIFGRERVVYRDDIYSNAIDSDDPVTKMRLIYSEITYEDFVEIASRVTKTCFAWGEVDDEQGEVFTDE